ncbi:hypothetical protein Droror1_Dr00022694, partial [Drosera rotundifolia]
VSSSCPGSSISSRCHGTSTCGRYPCTSTNGSYTGTSTKIIYLFYRTFTRCHDTRSRCCWPITETSNCFGTSTFCCHGSTNTRVVEEITAHLVAEFPSAVA